MTKIKTLQLLVIVISVVLSLSLSPTVFGFSKNTTDGYIHYGPSHQSIPSYLVSPQYNPTLEDQFGNATQTKLVHGDAILILNQTTQKLAYRLGENITVNVDLVNTGNKSVDIFYTAPWIALEIKNQTGYEVWPNSQLGFIPEFQGKNTLRPGEHLSEKPWGVTSGPDFPPPRLSVPGNYTIVSVTLFVFDTHDKISNSVKPLWSKPIQITILPEKVPEFPFTVNVMLIGMISVIAFYGMKFGK